MNELTHMDTAEVVCSDESRGLSVSKDVNEHFMAIHSEYSEGIIAKIHCTEVLASGSVFSSLG